MNEDITNFSLDYALKCGADYAEVRLEETNSSGFIVKNGNVEISGFENVSGLGIRFLINNALGFLSTNELVKSKIKGLISKAIRITKSTYKLKENVKLAESKANIKNYSVKEKIKLNDIDLNEKIKVLLDAEKLIKGSKVNVPGRYISLSNNITNEYLITSEGTRIKAKIPRVGFSYLLTIKENNRSAQRHWNYGAAAGWEAIKKWDMPNLLFNEVKSMQNNLKNGIKPPKGKVDLVVAPQVTGIMVHESVGHPFEADRILGREAAQAGESFITTSMTGTKIGSKVINIVDDPTIENSYGFYLYDNEGIKARRKFLIKDGMINEFLHNRQTAALMNLESNGSSRAVDYDKESIIRMSNTFLLPGDYKENELIEDIKLGIYMKNFMEWNIDDLRFHQKYVGAESYLIKNGKLDKPIINPTIEITTPTLWKSVDAVANNLELHAGNCGKGEPMQAIPVYLGGPSIRIKNIRLF